MPRTTHTPTGNYPAHAAVHKLDLEAAAARLLQQLPGHRRQTESLAREGGVSVMVMAMEAGDEIKEHSAAGVITVQVLRGHVALSADGQELDLRPGELALLQPSVPHQLRAEEQSVITLVVTGGDLDA